MSAKDRPLGERAADAYVTWFCDVWCAWAERMKRETDRVPSNVAFTGGFEAGYAAAVQDALEGAEEPLVSAPTPLRQGREEP